MAPGYLNFQTTFLIDLNEDHNRQPLIFPEDHNQCHEQQYAHLNFPLNSNHNPHHLQASSSSTTSSSTYPTNTCPIYFFNNPSSNDQAGYSFAGSQFQPYPIKQEFDDNYGSIGSSSYDQTAAVVAGTLEINKKDENNKNVLKFSISKKQDQSFPVDSTYRHQTLISTHEDQNQISSGVGGDGHSLFADQWMSSKMRLMKKMMKEEAVAGNEQPPAAKARNITCIDSNNYCNDVSNSTATIRVCSDCNTTKTPLWRSGPRGPKTLCNACGIRQRKARRAMAAAAAANNNISASSSQTHHHMSTIRTAAGVGSSNKKTSTGNNNGLLFGAQKKRSKLNNKPPTPRTSSHSNTNNSNSTGTCSTTDDDNGRKTSTNWFEEFASSLSEKLSFDQQVLFPEEEKDAAILLMAISCGLVHG